MTPAQPPATGGIPVPRVTHVRAVVKVPTSTRRFDAHDVAWLPSEGWFCSCGGSGRAGHCDHVRLVLATLTPAGDPR